MKNLLIAAGVFLATLVGLFLYVRPRPLDPNVKRLADIAGIAEQTCLSNTSDTSGLSLRLQLDAVKKVDGSASIQQQRSAARGAVQALPGELQKEEDSKIRECMEPWAEQLRQMAAKLQ